MANKPIQVNAVVPKDTKPYAMFPFGFYCNIELQNAQIGDIVEFCVDWRRDKRRLVRKCKIAVQSSVFTFLMQSLYGERMTIAKLMERWEAWAVVEGIGVQGFSREEALLVEVKPIEE